MRPHNTIGTTKLVPAVIFARDLKTVVIANYQTSIFIIIADINTPFVDFIFHRKVKKLISKLVRVKSKINIGATVLKQALSAIYLVHHQSEKSPKH